MMDGDVTTGPPRVQSHGLDWFHKSGTRIVAEIRVEVGNNEAGAGAGGYERLQLVFDSFCDSLRERLDLERQDDGQLV